MAHHRTRQLTAEGFIESFNGRLHNELLNETLLTSLAHVREALALCNHKSQHRAPAQRARQFPTSHLRQDQRSLNATGRRTLCPIPLTPPSRQGANEARILLITG